MALRYPVVFVLLILLSIGYFFFYKGKEKNNKFTKGSKIANTKYLKDNNKFKEKLKKYVLYRRIILGLFCVILLSCFILLSRLAKIDNSDNSKYNRDIFLCMDISMSVDELNMDLVENYQDIVKRLKGERFGISIFNTSSVTLVPLTDDYDYILEILKEIDKSLKYNNGMGNSSDFDYYTYQYITSGTLEGNAQFGSSLIGDGLASCVYSFSKKEMDRTRLIIFSTDNDLQGKPSLTLMQAASLSKKYNIKVFGIGIKGMSSSNKNDFQQAVNYTGGKYYEHSPSSINSIINDIEKTSKTLLKNQTQTKKTDIPTIPFILLMLSLSAFVYISKKVIR